MPTKTRKPRQAPACNVRRGPALKDPLKAARKVSKADPSRTAALRRQMTKEVRAAWGRVKGALVRLIEVEDALGLKASSALTANCAVGQTRDATTGRCGPGIGADVDRSEMPQIKDVDDFVLWVRSQGVGVALGDTRADTVKPTQRHFRQERVDAIPEGSRKPIILSKDDHVIDGTHRWVKAWQKDPESWLPCVVVGLPLDETLELARRYPKSVYAANTRWQPLTSAAKLEEFRHWLEGKFGEEVSGAKSKELWRRYAEAGFRKGAGRSFDDASGARRFMNLTPTGVAAYGGERTGFLRGAFGRPVSAEKVELLASRSFSDVQGVTADVSARMTRVLADGLVAGESPHAVARDLAEQLDIGRGRAETIARTEIVRAHAEGQLTALEALGVAEVGVMVEWEVTGDDKLCELCAALDGVVLSIEDARGLIPRHQNCRCSWVPAGVGESPRGQKRGDAAEEAMVESGLRTNADAVAAAVLWAVNAFCPTGRGGGVDATCPPYSGGGKAPLGERIKDKLVEKFRKMEARYGRRGAIAVMAGVVLLTPVPLPGSSLIPVGVAEGVRLAARLLARNVGSEELVEAAWELYLEMRAGGLLPQPREPDRATRARLAGYVAAALAEPGLTDNGRWVTLDSGQHVYVTDGGRVVPTVEQAEAAQRAKGKDKGKVPDNKSTTTPVRTEITSPTSPQGSYPALQPSDPLGGASGAPKMPRSDSPAVKAVPEADRTTLVAAFRRLDEGDGYNHVDLHRLGKELGWSRERLAHVLASAPDRVSMQTLEGYGGVTEAERGYLMADSGGRERYGAVRLRGTANQFCSTGKGGGVDPTCGKGDGGGSAKPQGFSDDASMKVYAAGVSGEVATMVGGITEEEAYGDKGQKDKKAFDVQVPAGRGRPAQDIEVKTVSTSMERNKSLSVHDDALLRKVEQQERTGHGFHTVAVDARGDFAAGTHPAAAAYSGHRLYYKRGGGRYSLGQMHQVKDAAELKKLIKAPDDRLPEKARGSLPPPPPKAELVERAAKAKASRDRKDKALKVKNKDKLAAQARARSEKAKALKQGKN